MKIFLDTEFMENGSIIDLISIGMVNEYGAELYLQNVDAVFAEANDWVARNVFPQLTHFHMLGRRDCQPWGSYVWCADGEQLCPWRHQSQIRNEVKDFCSVDDEVEIWGWYSAYDWVAFCQLFGCMVNLPDHFPKYCRDLKQWCDMLGNPRLPEPNGEHNALADARWNKEVYEVLKKHQRMIY